MFPALTLRSYARQYGNHVEITHKQVQRVLMLYLYNFYGTNAMIPITPRLARDLGLVQKSSTNVRLGTTYFVRTAQGALMLPHAVARNLLDVNYNVIKNNFSFYYETSAFPFCWEVECLDYSLSSELSDGDWDFPISNAKISDNIESLLNRARPEVRASVYTNISEIVNMNTTIKEKEHR